MGEGKVREPAGGGETPGKRKSRLAVLVLIVLLVVLGFLIALDAGGVRSTTLKQVWMYALAEGRPGLARVCYQFGTDIPVNVNKALREAVGKNQPVTAAVLLNTDADPNIKIDKGLPALYWCALRDYPETAAHLVRHGANIEYRTRKGWTPLAVAIKRHHNQIARLLIDAGADTGIHPKYIEKSPLWLAAGYGNMEMLEWFLKNGANTNLTKPISIPGRRPHSLVDFALRKEQYETAKRLIRETGPSRLTDENVEGQPFISNYCLAGVQRALTYRKYAALGISNVNPIVDALEKGDSDAQVFSLIEAQPDQLNRADERGETPLTMAVENNREAVVNRLIQVGCDIDMSDGNGYRPVMIAVEAGHLSIFRALVAAGADLSDSGCHGHSVSRVIVERNFIEAMKILVELKVDLNNPAGSPGTPLQYALGRGEESVEMARILMEGGADPTLRTSDLWSPIDFIRNFESAAELRPLLDSQLAARGIQERWILKDAPQIGKHRLHAISINKGVNPGPGPADRVPVIVSDATGPVVLVLNSYEPVEWALTVEPGVTLKKVYAVGYHPPKVIGLDPKTQLVRSDEGGPGPLHKFNIMNSDDFLQILSELEQLTGLWPTTLQSNFDGKGFVVDGRRSLDYRTVVYEEPPDAGVVMRPSPYQSGQVVADGLICTSSGPGSHSTARASAGYTGGRWYLEMTFESGPAGSPIDYLTTAGLLGADVLDAYFSYNPRLPDELGRSVPIPEELQKQLRDGSVLGMAADFDTGRLYLSIDGLWKTGPPGISRRYPHLETQAVFPRCGHLVGPIRQHFGSGNRQLRRLRFQLPDSDRLPVL